MENKPEKNHFDKLSELRQHYKSRAVTAEKIGLSYRHVGRLLNGTQPITPSNATLIDLLYEQVLSQSV